MRVERGMQMIASGKMRWVKGTLYNYGRLPPNYPVPSTLGAVVFDGYENMIYIDYPDGDNYFMCWDMWDGVMWIHRND